MWANPFSVVLVIRKIYIFIEPWETVKVLLSFVWLLHIYLTCLTSLGKEKSQEDNLRNRRPALRCPPPFWSEIFAEKKKHHHLLIFWKTAWNVKEFSEYLCHLVWTHCGFICNIILPIMISFSSIAYGHRKHHE